MNKRRYVVCGAIPDVQRWRRSQGLAAGDVRTVSTTNDYGLRGARLAPDTTVVILRSWLRSPMRVIEAVMRDLVLGLPRVGTGHVTVRLDAAAGPDVDVWDLSPAEWDAWVARHLAELGLMFDELAEQARTGDFQSTDARCLWMAIG